MRKNNNFWVDQSNNAWSCATHTKEEAIKKSRTLKNCNFCLDCENLTDCNHCIECSSCKDCYSCHNCTDCYACLHCDSLHKVRLGICSRESKDCIAISHCAHVSNVHKAEHCRSIDLPEKDSILFTVQAHAPVNQDIVATVALTGEGNVYVASSTPDGPGTTYTMEEFLETDEQNSDATSFIAHRNYVLTAFRIIDAAQQLIRSSE